MSQDQYTKKHKELHPEDESRRKEKQRQQEKLLRFHIRREFLGIGKVPKSIDQESDAFKRVKKAYIDEVNKHVVVSYD